MIFVLFFHFFFFLSISCQNSNITLFLFLTARMFFGLPHDILSDILITDDTTMTESQRFQNGLKYMEHAAEAMERSAIVFMAQSYDLGINGVTKDPDRALYW